MAFVDSAERQIYHPRAMGQSNKTGPILLVLVIAALTGCGKSESTATQAPAKPATRPSVASLVPAATDLIIGMGLGDHLAAVSNFEPNREMTRDLPRVGDYQTTDWERLNSLKPDLMVVQISSDRVPAGMMEKAQQLNIHLVNVKINRLADIFSTISQLGDALNAPQSATLASITLVRKLEQVRKAAIIPIPTLVVVSDNGPTLAGPGTYLDDLITVAGGKNVAEKLNNPYPSADRETLLSLKPQVIIELLPGASAQSAQKSKEFWQSMPEISAVRYGRVFVINDADALLPGYNIARLAEEMSRLIHSQIPTTLPAAAP